MIQNYRIKNRFRWVAPWVIMCLVFAATSLNAQDVVRPLILVTPAERNSVLQKIENQKWAKSIYADFKKKVDEEVETYQKNPGAYLRQLPFDWAKAKPGQIPPFQLTHHIENGVHKNLDNATKEEWESAALLIKYLQVGVDCGMAYYVTENKKYAQCATDILYSFVKAVQQAKLSDRHGRGGWLFPDDGFREVREIGAKVPLIYDFVATYLKTGGQAYDLVLNKKMNFPLEEAQQVFRTYADITINYGQTASNHPVLEAPNLVYNALALDDKMERDQTLSYFLTTSTKNQDALPVLVNNYKKKGDIWPETSQYLNHSTAIITRLMLIVNRYNPALKLGAKYTNVLYALPRLDDLVYPNQQLIRWGDGHRQGSALYHSFEDAVALAKIDGLQDVISQFGPLINRARQEGKYKRTGMESVFWHDNEIKGDTKPLTLPRTDHLPHAGIFLQRNVSTTNKAEDGLMCFVGGAPMVHGHAEGMNIELYGEGQVLGVDNGRGRYAQDIHENYSRIFAAHNTVIVNGSSQGEGGWSNLAIDTVRLISMEPLAAAKGVSPYHSFTQTRFEDNRGDRAEATQQRTLALIRTSPTTGYYVDVFRSKSRLPNEYHDYLYHNIGDTLAIENTGIQFKATPDRYMANANAKWGSGQYRNPGWHFFKDVQTSPEYNKSVTARFAVRQLKQGPIYMQLYIPGFEGREYTKVMAPQTFEAPKPYDVLPTPTLIIRKKGEAWMAPFVVIYEPFNEKEKDQTIQSVEKLENNGVYKGLKVISKTPEKNLVQYIITQSKGETYKNPELSIVFTGTFAVITLDDNGKLQNMYIGEGEKLVFKNHVLTPNSNKCAYKVF